MDQRGMIYNNMFMLVMMTQVKMIMKHPWSRGPGWARLISGQSRCHLSLDHSNPLFQPKVLCLLHHKAVVGKLGP
jgi:hypothetical protein